MIVHFEYDIKLCELNDGDYEFWMEKLKNKLITLKEMPTDLRGLIYRQAHILGIKLSEETGFNVFLPPFASDNNGKQMWLTVCCPIETKRGK